MIVWTTHNPWTHPYNIPWRLSQAHRMHPPTASLHPTCTPLTRIHLGKSPRYCSSASRCHRRKTAGGNTGGGSIQTMGLAAARATQNREYDSPSLSKAPILFLHQLLQHASKDIAAVSCDRRATRVSMRIGKHTRELRTFTISGATKNFFLYIHYLRDDCN